ncbi:hypothetical protein WMY93_022413 [Mugilogobius chulae]|uniref:Uncharacterized protein n=1 Tax=Mugilogobius chulae TaxID=88201 RepID=A0AAW0NJA2_9GOBI
MSGFSDFSPAARPKQLLSLYLVFQELISSPVGSRSSQSSSGGVQSQPLIHEMSQSLDQSEVLDVSDQKRRSDTFDSRGETQSHEEGHSQFGLLELSQSQDFGSEPVQNQTRTRPGAVRLSPFESGSVQDETKPGPSGALLHSQVQDQDQDQDQDQIMSTQEDLFDKPGPTGASAISSTPAQTLALLQLSGSVQGTLVAQQPLTTRSHGHFTSSSRPIRAQRAGPASSTPVSQNAPVFEPQRPLSVPSQPQFSHDVFVATQSQKEESQSKPSVSSPPAAAAASLFSQSSLNLCINTELQDEDEEATQIEQLDEQNSLKTSAWARTARPNTATQIRQRS